MSRSRIAEWSYQLGCLSAVAAVVYRTLWFGGLGARVFDLAHVLPYNLLQLSILSFAISIASDARAMATREQDKAVANRKAA